MLGKLFQHEWKRVYKVECLLLAVLFVFSVAGALMFASPMGNLIFGDGGRYMTETEIFFWTMTFITSIFMYVIVVIGVMYGSMIYLGVNFYRSMYTDEGYLAHTLPVTPHQLLGSKVLVGALWTFIMQVGMAISIFLLVFSMVVAEDPTMLGDMKELFAELEVLEPDTKGMIIHGGIMYLCAVLVSPFASMSILFGALTIGQLSKKHKGMMGILAYFGIMVANSIITQITQTIGSILAMRMESYSASGYNEVMFYTYDVQILITLLIGAGLYFLSHYIISQKLNLN
ncbi:MAG: hypothetical protein J6C84_06760 [Lachnospiraceae bacterium]|nr:hypothetical protein [Lachnospiraceae bacterium]